MNYTQWKMQDLNIIVSGVERLPQSGDYSPLFGKRRVY